MHFETKVNSLSLKDKGSYIWHWPPFFLFPGAAPRNKQKQKQNKKKKLIGPMEELW